jgi:hypothetical protein
MNDSYVVQSMSALVCGKDLLSTTDKSVLLSTTNNTCDINYVAEPDNVAYDNENDVLYIGEDTDHGHTNDVLWAYDIDSGTLARILTTPYGTRWIGVDMN